MDHGNSSAEEERSIRLDIRKLSETSGGSSSKTIFQPGSRTEQKNSSPTSVSSETSAPLPAPEKKLTLFALRLALLEKVASKSGTLGFVWATVVLLGGFAIALDKTDFWFITIILLIEGTRIFSRSHELELQHRATWTITDAGIHSFRALISSSLILVKKVKAILFIGSENESHQNQEMTQRKDFASLASSRRWKSADVPMLPYTGWVFLSRNVSKLFYWLQLLSATACLVLSLLKLIKRNYGDDIDKEHPEKKNLPWALTIFYSLAFAEALLFLIEKAYWEWKVSGCKILEKVNEECGLEKSDAVSIRRFFYDAYSKCVNESIFDGLKMDMVSFAMELLDSSSSDEQLIGTRILCRFTMNELYSKDTLQKIGINLDAIERLVEMLNWKNLQQEEIRRSAAEILSKLAGKKQNSLRVTGILGAMESISSLLQNTRSFVAAAADEIGEKRITHDHASYDFWGFSNMGLVILKRLARDHDNCGKIGKTRGLLPKIIDFTHAEARLLLDENAATSQILAVKRSLKLIRMLVSTTGDTGKLLRKKVSELVFTISNIREILRQGEKHPALQELGINILTFLTLDEDAGEKIGCTGGVLKELFTIFLEKKGLEDRNQVRTAAGEALAMLAIGNKNNCHRVLKLRVLKGLVEALDDPLLRLNAARILRNLCVYTSPEFLHQLEDVKMAARTVLNNAMASNESKLQEVMVGLAAQVFKFMSPEETSDMFRRAGIDENTLAETLVEILKKHEQPAIKVPRIRRFAIELAVWMMNANPENVKIFHDKGMKKQLESVLETMAEIENFDVFSGTVGVRINDTKIHSLVEAALELLEAT